MTCSRSPHSGAPHARRAGPSCWGTDRRRRPRTPRSWRPWIDPAGRRPRTADGRRRPASWGSSTPRCTASTGSNSVAGGRRFVVGVVKKYGDDHGSMLAALVSYYAFLALLPAPPGVRHGARLRARRRRLPPARPDRLRAGRLPRDRHPAASERAGDQRPGPRLRHRSGGVASGAPSALRTRRSTRWPRCGTYPARCGPASCPASPGRCCCSPRSRPV